MGIANRRWKGEMAMGSLTAARYCRLCADLMIVVSLDGILEDFLRSSLIVEEHRGVVALSLLSLNSLSDVRIAD